MPKLLNSVKYTKQEHLALAELVKQHVPIGPAEWRLVATHFNNKKLGPERNATSLKATWLRLRFKKKPTGNYII